MKLAPDSWLRAPFVVWPPERVHSLSFDGGRLRMQYDDEWVPYQNPVAGMAEARWLATYLGDWLGWSLKRVGFLAYE